MLHALYKTPHKAAATTNSRRLEPTSCVSCNRACLQHVLGMESTGLSSHYSRCHCGLSAVVAPYATHIRMRLSCSFSAHTVMLLTKRSSSSWMLAGSVVLAVIWRHEQMRHLVQRQVCLIRALLS